MGAPVSNSVAMPKRLPTPFPVAMVGAGLIGRSWAIVCRSEPD
jgi:hypothetical protein